MKKNAKKKGLECNKFLLILVVAAVILAIGLLIAKIYVNKELKKASVKLETNCEGEIITRSVKEGNKINCHVIEDYTFTIKKIKNDSVEIEASDYGLNDGSNYGDKKKDFIIYKGKVLVLTSNTFDYQEKVSFEIK